MQKDILDFLSEFAVFLQDHKFAVSESALAHLLRSVESAGVDITEEDEMLAALSVCLAKTGEQVAKMKALFREFLSKKTIPQREKQKEKEKQEKRKELDLFVSDAQKQLENLKKQKERIRKNIIQKAHENESNDSLIIKPSSMIHRADFIGGGSIQTMNAEFVRLSEKPFKKLTEAEKNQMREYLRQNLLAFKTRMTRNINSKRRLSLNLEETMRESIRTCGQPINLIYKQPRRSKADLVLILDVSGSCKDASEMMLTFIGLLKEAFPRGCSAFAFVNSLYDISRVYDTEYVDNAAKQILTMIPRSGQYSNYERPLRSMWKEYRNRISNDSMIIFIGDARNNKNDAGENYIKNICRKAKCAYWLNTDDRKKWDQGDSIASVYGHYAAMYEIRNIRQLLGFLSEMK